MIKKNERGRKYHPRKGSLNLSKYWILIKSSIGVKIIRYGMFIPQLPVQFKLPVKNQKIIRLWLRC
jgi:hypothetical protein